MSGGSGDMAVCCIYGQYCVYVGAGVWEDIPHPSGKLEQSTL